MPILDHIYSGPAWKMAEHRPFPHEHIRGAFRVIDRGKHFALVGNGEDPETRWMIFEDDLDRLEQA